MSRYFRIYKVLPNDTLEPTDELIEAPELEDGSLDTSAVDARVEELNQNGYGYCASIEPIVIPKTTKK